jgi:hypothetical protein
MEISGIIEDNHGAKFGIWVHKNVQEEKEDICKYRTKMGKQSKLLHAITIIT